MNYNLTLKSRVENLTKGQGHDLTSQGHAAYQSNRIGGLSTPTYVVFSALACLHQKLLPKPAGDPS